MALYEGQFGNAFSWGDERIVEYPPNLTVMIDAVPYRTIGRAVEETHPGLYSVRRWVAVQAVSSNGHRYPARLIDERGVRGLRQRAEQARLQQQHEGS
jgi:hypothetical protein